MNTAIESDEDIQALLSGEALRGPRMFRGKPLADLSRGLRDLRNKIVLLDDTAEFHDAALIYILGRAYGATPEERAANRRALLIECGDVSIIKTNVSLFMDELSDDKAGEATRLVKEILGLVEKAEVSISEKKSSSEQSAEPSPTTTPLPSCPSLSAPDGSPTSSAGN